jgi:hypothetical protein
MLPQPLHSNIYTLENPLSSIRPTPQQICYQGKNYPMDVAADHSFTAFPITLLLMLNSFSQQSACRLVTKTISQVWQNLKACL